MLLTSKMENTLHNYSTTQNSSAKPSPGVSPRNRLSNLYGATPRGANNTTVEMGSYVLSPGKVMHETASTHSRSPDRHNGMTRNFNSFAA